MAKFKIKFKLQGLELEVEGSREDIPLIAESIGQQFTGLLQPAIGIVEGDAVDITKKKSNNTIEIQPNQQKKKPRKSKASTTSKTTEVEKVIDWVHNPANWGTPSQSWNPTKKSIWLLYVVQKEKQFNGLSASQITSTFNKHFRQSGIVQASNVSRDLGKAKRNLLTGEDTTKNPSEWFLTDSGIQEAEKLIQEAKGNSIV